MPQLDYALLADYVRVEGGLAHVIAGNVDTVYANDVPAAQNISLLIVLKFTREECGRPWPIDVVFQDEDGERLVQVNGQVQAEWAEGLPPGWRVGAALGMNFGIVIQQHGLHSFEVLVNGEHRKSLSLRVIPRGQQA
jgi:hypothetical protein